jgi:hypothetical protein
VNGDGGDGGDGGGGEGGVAGGDGVEGAEDGLNFSDHSRAMELMEKFGASAQGSGPPGSRTSTAFVTGLRAGWLDMRSHLPMAWRS